jgi:poly(3-hydroxybutyrate) depolymerase
MQKQVLARLGLVVLGSLAMSCAAADSGPSVPDGTGGKTVGTGTGGAGATGSGGAGPAGSGGAGATGRGGAGATGTGGAGAAGRGGAGATGTGGAGATGTGGAGAAGSGGAGATGTGGAGAAGSGGAGLAGRGGAGATGTGGAGAAGSGGAGGAMGGTGGGAGDYWGGLKNPPRKSAGCDKPATITNGNKTIMSGGMQRTFIVDIPADYDPAKPYRLFYVSHGQGGRADDVAGFLNWFGVKAQATAAKEPAVFIAGQGLNNTWGQPDHVFFDDVTTFAKNGLCIDTTRVFVTGMSMGGMYTYSLSTDRQKSFRAGVGLAPTNFVIWLPNPKLKDPIAWMQTTGMSDTTCAWDAGSNHGSKYIAFEKAADNGCTIPATIPTWTSGNHVCYDFAGCKPGYPVKACTFDGGHVDSNRDPGSNVNWIAVESWKFFTQF